MSTKDKPNDNLISGSISSSDVKNKLRRIELVRKQKQMKSSLKKKEKLRRRKMEEKDPKLKEKRLKENIQKTLENTREKDDTMVDPEDEEIKEDEEEDEFADYFKGCKDPKVLITTSKKAHSATYEFADELVSVFHDAKFVKRHANYEIKHIAEFSANRGFTDVIIINEDHKKPNAISLIHLPNGPTAYFKLTSIIPGKEIHNHGKCTAHKPEIILNNFNSRLGRNIGRFFATLFPPAPQFNGRQVVTLHNQRDFIFFRRHRYIFKTDKKAALQEIGPRFTLKLQWLQNGIYDTINGDFEWIRKPEMETSRKKFFL